MIHTEDCESCSGNKGNEMHGCKAEESIAPTQKVQSLEKVCKTVPVGPVDRQHSELCLAGLSHTIAVCTEQELDIQRSE